MSRAEASLSASNTAASKIVRMVSHFFLPMQSTNIPTHTCFLSPCEAEEEWAFEQLVQLFPEDERSKGQIMDKVEKLCDKCECCTKDAPALPTKDTQAL